LNQTANYQGVPVTCPNCKTRFRAPVITIVDAGLYPEAKTLLLSGQLNMAVCPQCGNAGMLHAPLVYHDADKELLLTFMPPELGMSEIEQQRVVGDLTNRLISSLPAEKRKGYLLRPRNYLRLEALIKDVLAADGITQEMLDAQRAKMELMERLLRADKEARRAIAQANDQAIDYEFMDLLSMNIELAERSRQPGLTGELLGLRQDLVESTAVGREMAAREEAIQDLGENVTREGLLEKLIAAAMADEPVKVETMVAVARPAIDYVFYQQLAARIEAAQQAGDAARAKKLTSLRETILDLTAEIDQEAQQAAQEAGDALQEAMDSEDIEAWLQRNAGRVDNLFLSLLAANLRAAEQTGQAEAVERLQRVNDAVMDMILKSQPPEIQLINRLLASDYPEGTRALLEENRDALQPELFDMMAQLRDDLGQNGRQEAAERLGQIQEQARSLLTR
jgi:hypothetical protein